MMSWFKNSDRFELGTVLGMVAVIIIFIVSSLGASDIYPTLTNRSWNGVASWAQPVIASGAALPAVGSAATGDLFILATTSPLLYRLQSGAWAQVGTSPSGAINATQLQGEDIATTTPDDGNVLTYIVASNAWVPLPPSAASGSGQPNNASFAFQFLYDVPTTTAKIGKFLKVEIEDPPSYSWDIPVGSDSANAVQIQGVDVSSATPLHGQTLIYDAGSTSWNLSAGFFPNYQGALNASVGYFFKDSNDNDVMLQVKNDSTGTEAAAIFVINASGSSIVIGAYPSTFDDPILAGNADVKNVESKLILGGSSTIDIYCLDPQTGDPVLSGRFSGNVFEVFGIASVASDVYINGGSEKVASVGSIISSSAVATISTKVATYAATISDDYLLGDSAAATFSFLLPPAGSSTAHIFHFKLITTTLPNTIYIVASGSNTIDGSSTRTLSAPYQYYKMISDGSNWHLF